MMVTKMKSILMFLLVMLNVPRIRVVCSFTPAVLCGRIPGLSQIQRMLCTESPDATASLGAGHILGLRECQFQFKGHRWNCTNVWKKDVFGHVVIVGSREAAFTYAIASAGAVHAITAACARGNISLCGCEALQKLSYREQSQAWKWGGCSADINFGMKYARKFLDSREIEGDARSVMNLHNNRAGRKIVKSLLRTDCKCHGVSGSCVMKTCWKSLPPFRVIGDVLMKKYNKARHVQAVNSRTGGLTLVLRRRGKLTTNPPRLQQRPKRMEIVYLQSSPNYCDKDPILGSLGTDGRQCNRTAQGINSCDLLCCGRGYNTHQIIRTWQCRCKFQWCCNVQCEICHERIEEYTCK